MLRGEGGRRVPRSQLRMESLHWIWCHAPLSCGEGIGNIKPMQLSYAGYSSCDREHLDWWAEAVIQ